MQVAQRALSTYLTSSGIGCKFSFTYPAEGGISALLFPTSETSKSNHNDINRYSVHRNSHDYRTDIFGEK